MAINVVWQPDATLLAYAANSAGYGDYARRQRDQQQALAEQQRQFDIQQAFRETQFGEQVGQNRFNQQLAYDNMGFDADKFSAGLAERDIGRQQEAYLAELAAGNRLQQQRIQGATQLGVNEQDNYADLFKRQMMEQGLAQRQEEELQSKAALELHEQQKLPAWVPMALKAGTHGYAPEQKSRMRQLQDARAKLRTAQNLSPEEKLQLDAQLAQEYWEVESNPMEVPSYERQPSIQEQFEAETHVVQDPLTGGDVRVSRDRSGAWRYMTPPQNSQAIKETDIAARQQQQEADRQRDYETQVYESQVRAWEAREPRPQQFERPDGTDDSAAYAKALENWQNQMPTPPPLSSPQNGSVVQGDDRGPMGPPQLPPGMEDIGIPGPPPMAGGAPPANDPGFSQNGPVDHAPFVDNALPMTPVPPDESAPPLRIGARPKGASKREWIDSIPEGHDDKNYTAQKPMVPHKMYDVVRIPGEGVVEVLGVTDDGEITGSGRLVLVENREDIEKLPKGTRFLLPDGRIGTRT